MCIKHVRTSYYYGFRNKVIQKAQFGLIVHVNSDWKRRCLGINCISAFILKFLIKLSLMHIYRIKCASIQYILVMYMPKSLLSVGRMYNSY